MSRQCLDVCRQCLKVPRHWLDLSCHFFMYLYMSRHFIVMQLVLSMAPFHLLRHYDKNEVWHDFSFTGGQWHWYQCHTMPTESSVASLHLSVYDNWNDAICASISVMTWMASSMVPLHSLGKDNQNEDATWPFWSCDANSTGTGIKYCWWCHQWYHCIFRSRQLKWQAAWLFVYLMQFMLATVSCDADGAINSTIGFLRSRQLK